MIMSKYYSKLKVCDYCKDLDCEIAMIKTELGTICPLCSKTVDAMLNNAVQESPVLTPTESKQMAIEIETY